MCGCCNRAVVRMQHLDGDVAIVLEVVREIHGGHAALAEFAFHSVSVGQARPEGFDHRSLVAEKFVAAGRRP
jgi:hypothetical protein